MQDPNDLIDAIVEVQKTNTDLVALLENNADNILPLYLDYSRGSENTLQSIVEQKPGTLLVYWIGTRTTQFNKRETIKHDFEVSIRNKGKVAPIFVAFREGIATSGSDSRKFKFLQVTTDVYPPEDMSFDVNTQVISRNFGLFDFAKIKLTLTERGLDN